MQHLTRSDALGLGLLIEATDIACEQGYEMQLYVTPAVMQAHAVAGLRAIVLVIATTPELCDGPRSIRVDMHDGGPALSVFRDDDGCVIVTRPDA